MFIATSRTVLFTTNELSPTRANFMHFHSQYLNTISHYFLPSFNLLRQTWIFCIKLKKKKICKRSQLALKYSNDKLKKKKLRTSLWAYTKKKKNICFDFKKSVCVCIQLRIHWNVKCSLQNIELTLYPNKKVKPKHLWLPFVKNSIRLEFTNKLLNSFKN